MGGHGGLNILPQKRWNVYNRDNRLKVQQDEAKAKEAEDAERARAEQAEREYRHQLLLNRAQRRDAPDAPAANEPPQLVQALPTTQSIAQPINNQQQPEGHINFWQEEEMHLKAQHPEVEAAKKDEARKRGKTDYYTSDPKFDERFQLGYQMKGDQPWWAQPKAETEKMAILPTRNAVAIASSNGQQNKPLPLDVEHRESNRQQESGKTGQQHGRSPQESRDEQSSSSYDDDEKVKAAKQFLKQVLGGQLPKLDTLGSNNSSGTSSESESADSQGSHDRRHHREKKRKREERRNDDCRESQDDVSHKRKSKRKERSPSEKRKHKKEKKLAKHESKERKRSRSKGKRESQLGSDVVVFKTVEQLRAERLEREQGERSRARMVLVGALEKPETSGYNSAFGYAQSLKKHR